MPAHVSRISTADLCKLHDIQDPVQAVLSKLRKRLRNLLRKTTRAPDITTSPQVVLVLRDKIHQIETLPEPEGEKVLSHACQDCGATFETQRGLHLHRTRLHPGSIERFIPSCFDRKLHAVACLTKFRQWKGLRDHLLSGACPAPQRLRDLKDEDARSTHPDVVQLHQLRQDVAGLPRHKVGDLARQASAGLLTHRCLVCNFWTPDHT